MGNHVEIGSAVAVSDPESFLTGSLETGIVTLTLCSQSVKTLETEAFSVNGHPVIIRNRLVFCTAAVLLSVVPVLVIAGTAACPGLPERTAVFLPETSATVCSPAVLVHGKPRLADRVPGRKTIRILRIPLVQRDNRFTVINIPDQVVDRFDVVAFVRKESTLFERKRLCSVVQNLPDDG